MAYTPPTADDLKAIFPAFAAVDDAAITLWLDRAARVVDESWPEADFAHARMLLAAHYLVQQGLGTGAEAEAAAAGAAGFTRLKSGSLEIERSVAGAGSEYAATSYGRQFAPLLRVVKGGARVTSSGTLPAGCAPYGYGCGRIPGW